MSEATVASPLPAVIDELWERRTELSPADEQARAAVVGAVDAIDAYVDSGTMVDTWATVGSGAQIGKNVHLSGGAGIGGVLEPPSAVPVVVEDEAMVGSRCMVVGGARVRQGCMLGAGAILTPTTHVIDVETGAELPRGEAPAWSVCVGGTRPRTFPGGTFGMPCLLVLKRLAEGVRHDKSALNAILRDHGVDA